MTIRPLRRAAILLGALAAAACESAPPKLQPAQVLVDSLGLTIRDVVYEIGIRTEAGSEVATPASIQISGAARVSFRSDDARARRITTDTLAMSPAQRGFARRFGQGSPPLVQPEARWVVDLSGAPAGEYVFHATGSAGAASIAVRVLQDD